MSDGKKWAIIVCTFLISSVIAGQTISGLSKSSSGYVRGKSIASPHAFVSTVVGLASAGLVGLFLFKENSSK